MSLAQPVTNHVDESADPEAQPLTTLESAGPRIDDDRPLKLGGSWARSSLLAPVIDRLPDRVRSVKVRWRAVFRTIGIIALVIFLASVGLGIATVVDRPWESRYFDSNMIKTTLMLQPYTEPVQLDDEHYTANATLPLVLDAVPDTRYRYREPSKPMEYSSFLHLHARDSTRGSGWGGWGRWYDLGPAYSSSNVTVVVSRSEGPPHMVIESVWKATSPNPPNDPSLPAASPGLAYRVKRESDVHGKEIAGVDNVYLDFHRGIISHNIYITLPPRAHKARLSLEFWPTSSWTGSHPEPPTAPITLRVPDEDLSFRELRMSARNVSLPPTLKADILSIHTDSTLSGTFSVSQIVSLLAGDTLNATIVSHGSGPPPGPSRSWWDQAWDHILRTPTYLEPVLLDPRERALRGSGGRMHLESARSSVDTTLQISKSQWPHWKRIDLVATEWLRGDRANGNIKLAASGFSGQYAANAGEFSVRRGDDDITPPEKRANSWEAAAGEQQTKITASTESGNVYFNF